MKSNISLVTQLLKFTYGLVPIIAGLDKFTNLLTNWSLYVPSGISGLLPFSISTFMAFVGIIEIVAGILVLRLPSKGALVVAVWLATIALILLIGGQYDIAVRDLVMAIGALSLFKLAQNQTAPTN